MRSKIIFLQIALLFLSGNALGLCEKAVRASIYDELNKVLSDKEAFPKDSKQYQAVSQFRKKLHSLFRGTGTSTEGQGESKDEELPTTNAQSEPKEDDKKTGESPATPESDVTRAKEHDENPPQDKPQDPTTTPITTPATTPATTPSAKVMRMRDYVSVRKEHMSLKAELEQVKELKGQVDAVYQDLLQQSKTIQTHNQATKTSGEMSEDYEKALEKYAQDEEKYEKLKGEYRQALEQYDQHKEAYRSKLTR